MCDRMFCITRARSLAQLTNTQGNKYRVSTNRHTETSQEHCNENKVNDKMPCQIVKGFVQFFPVFFCRYSNSISISVLFLSFTHYYSILDWILLQDNGCENKIFYNDSVENTATCKVILMRHAQAFFALFNIFGAYEWICCLVLSLKHCCHFVSEPFYCWCPC